MPPPPKPAAFPLGVVLLPLVPPCARLALKVTPRIVNWLLLLKMAPPMPAPPPPPPPC